jgi:hypothetical protein
LFVIPASDALRLELPATFRRDTVRVAVADTRSGVLGSMVARIGYDYLVRRPVHPEMLKMLFARLLFRGSEGRRHERHAAGWPVRLRVGWRAQPATLLDVSAGGARLLTHREIDLLAEARLRIPRSGVHSARTLRGRVIRKRAGADGTWTLALRFENELDAPALESLRARLLRAIVGPVEAPPRGLLDWMRGPLGERSPKAPPEPAPVASAEAEPAPERRRNARVELEREVLDLDPTSRVPRNVLVGRDLSARGLRVDPHPDLRADTRLDLVVFDAAGAPLEVAARTARDDGDRGWLLEFEDLDEATSVRIDALIETLPAIQRLDDDASGGIVFAKIATDRVGMNELLRVGSSDEREPPA